MSDVELPGPDSVVLHVHGADGQSGPYSRRQLKERLASGASKPGDHYWFDGMEDWMPIKSAPALLELPVEAEPVSPAATQAASTDAGLSEDDRLDGIFSSLVKKSWEYHADHAFASHIDEVFLGAIITSTLDTGANLIDITSDGTHHYLRFEDATDNSRVIVRFTHLTPGLATAKVLGQKADMVVGYGERVKNFGKVWSAIKAEYKSGLLNSNEPGTISVDGDMNSQYVYCQVPLYLTIDDYVKRSYHVDTDLLREHLDGTLHALRKYLRGRFY